MKKTYLKPTTMVVKLQQTGIICTSGVRSVNGNTNIYYGGGGSGPARARQRNRWEDEW